MGDKWVREELTLPNITGKYFLQFEARMGMRIFSDVAIDDFSLSPECFGFNIPKEHLQEYNYWDPRIGISKKTHLDYVGKKCKLIEYFMGSSGCLTIFYFHFHCSPGTVNLYSARDQRTDPDGLREGLQWY